MNLSFNLPAISVKTAFNGLPANGNPEWIAVTEHQKTFLKLCKPGENFSKYHPNGSGFNDIKMPINDPAPTLSAQQHKYFHHTEVRHLYKSEFSAIGSFPEDYDFLDQKYGYIIGMSVPPVMTAQVANQIRKQWFPNGRAS